jgi:hypothetical protein
MVTKMSQVRCRIWLDPKLIGPLGSGSVIQDYGSADPDPKEIFMVAWLHSAADKPTV